MNHPHDLLADLVDGTLSTEHRARVDAHLAACPSCRSDVAAATAGRTAARTLPEEPAPADLYGRVAAAAGDGARPAPRWYRWAGAAAAAAIVLAIAVALPDIGDDPSGAADTAGDGEAAPAAPERALAGDAAVGLEVQDRNYDSQGLQRLASEATSATSQFAEEADGAMRGSPQALRCIAQAFERQPTGRLTRLIEADFEGRAAYIALYLEGPGADQPPDTAVAWVAARDDCSILSFAQAQL